MLIPHLMLLLVTVHPHWRGEHTQSRERYPPDNGSSPLAWGTYVNGADVSTVVRFIPTGVGNIYKRYANLDDDAVHPHWRGEHFTLSTHIVRVRGSSPLAWGTWNRCSPTPHTGRFIPTGVGNIRTIILFSSISTVHPHWRGEHFCSDSFHHPLIGSSPLAWGTCGSHGRKTTTSPVHPHWRGEHVYIPPETDVNVGSSPLAWGTCDLQQLRPYFCGSSPLAWGT